VNDPRRRKVDSSQIAVEPGAKTIPRWRIISNRNKPTKIVAANDLGPRRVGSSQVAIETGAKVKPPT